MPLLAHWFSSILSWSSLGCVRTLKTQMNSLYMHVVQYQGTGRAAARICLQKIAVALFLVILVGIAGDGLNSSMGANITAHSAPPGVWM